MTGPRESGCPSEPDGTQDGPAASRQSWLLASYPRSWRRRYGPEFAELLLADRAERGRSWRRDADIAVAGLRARLASAGLAGHPLDTGAAARAADVAVRVAAGVSDPFYPGVRALAARLPAEAVVYFGKGCHTGPFFDAQLPPSLQFLAARL